MSALHGSSTTTPLARQLRRAMTPAEMVLWRELRRRQLGVRFRRQHPTARFVLDFFAPSRLLAVEVDGRVHDSQRERDREREMWLAGAGVRTVRCTNDEVMDALPDVLTRIRAALEAAAALPLGEGQGRGSSSPHDVEIRHGVARDST